MKKILVILILIGISLISVASYIDYKDNNIKAYIGIYKNSIVILISKKSSLISDEIDKLYEK